MYFSESSEIPDPGLVNFHVMSPHASKEANPTFDLSPLLYVSSHFQTVTQQGQH